MSDLPKLLKFAILLLSSPTHARISKIIDKREPFAGGHEFPVTGAYEK